MARPTPHRRAVLTSALGGLTAAALGPTVLSACGGSPEGDLDATSLGDRLTLLRGAGANILALAADDGFVVVDSGAAEHAERVVRQLRSMDGRGRVAALFNTHYHADQTGGNALLKDAGARVIAHERTRLRLATPLWDYAEQTYRPAQPEDVWPTETFYGAGEMAADGETVDYGYLIHAHTDGDVYVFFRDANVLAVGDVASPERDPVFDWFAGGWLGGRVDALAQLLELADEGTQIVPAYGPVMARAELEAEHAMMSELYDRTHTLFRQGRSAADMLEEGALDGLGREFADPGKLLYDIHKGLWGHQSSMSPDIV